ncbi:hypothetical protein GCM10007385_43830 [Tateyamaria omphalii]|nr:hypothetical protein GCM10007385_43830 [Tateyamaria omphalii]
MFGTGVNPSPVPEPQSFQKPRSGTRAMAIRAPPIIVSAHARSRHRGKRKKDMEVVWFIMSHWQRALWHRIQPIGGKEIVN